MIKSKERIVLACRDAAKAIFAHLRGYRLPEIDLIHYTVNEALTEKRLNLVLPTLTAKSMFGGGATAIRLLRAMEGHFARARIVVLGENEGQFERSSWPDWVLASRDPHARYAITFLDGGNATLEVGVADTFIATTWHTAYQIKHWMSALCAKFPARDARFVYLIQDFEPAFYPWSSQYLMANSTYVDGSKIVALFNTELLGSYFRSHGYSFRSEYCFEPKMNEVLARLRQQLNNVSKERLILVYGRPSVHRNAFELAIEALREWSRDFADASQWEVVSLGERHRDIRLPNGVTVRSLGKVAIPQYASLMARASIGLSLMVSPHPSYPPLEMADFGVRVITNHFAKKNLAERSGNIHSVSDTSPVGIALALKGLCEGVQIGRPSKIEYQSAFLAVGEEFPFLAALLSDFADNNSIRQVSQTPVLGTQGK